MFGGIENVHMIKTGQGFHPRLQYLSDVWDNITRGV